MKNTNKIDNISHFFGGEKIQNVLRNFPLYVFRISTRYNIQKMVTNGTETLLLAKKFIMEKMHSKFCYTCIPVSINNATIAQKMRFL